MHDRTTSYQFKVTDKRRVTFYAAVFDEPTTITELDANGKLVTYTEVIKSGAFAAALESDEEVIANIDHDPARTFARRSDGTLVLQEDPHGLWCSCWVPEGEFGDTILRDIEAGKLDGCSFKFGPVQTRNDNGVVVRVAVALADVCLTATPAYPETEVHHLRTQQTHQRTKYLFTKLKLMKLKRSRLNTSK